eukprot:TRINITY_DN8702_c0_g2_i1.p1 TRINITY_DN8702_c0_g2~~TRINITY_DN8702_c0_g2_i1.p1  ORF type:complete len:311 (-),score=52.05 TRINITY_DN8702_c0_g2_i1:977-1909(-)
MGGKQPYIMPDGSSLKSYLRSNGFTREVEDGRGQRRKGQQRKKSKGKAYASRWEVASGVISSVKTRKAENPQESHELEGLSKLGMRKLMRCMSDRMLRDMAGPMTATFMDSLYQPCPFGDTGYRTAFRQLSENPNSNEIWSKFLDISMDKEAKVLERWEAHLKAEKMAKKSKLSPAQLAWNRWGRISAYYRKFLKKAHWQQVWDIESQILEITQLQEGEVLDVPYNSFFEKMLIFGLAQYHQLHFEDDEVMDTVVLRHRQKENQQSSSSSSQLTVTTCDILEAMEVFKGQGLNPKMLQRFLQENESGVNV